MTTPEWDRIPVVISFAEAKQMVETYGFAGSQGQTVLEGQRLVPREPSDTVFVFMHPATTLHLLPMPTALANAEHDEPAVLLRLIRIRERDEPLPRRLAQ